MLKLVSGAEISLSRVEDGCYLGQTESGVKEKKRKKEKKYRIESTEMANKVLNAVFNCKNEEDEGFTF